MTPERSRRVPRSRRSLLRRMALLFVITVIVTALALSLSAYFITKAAQEDEALEKALSQSRFNLFLADSMLPAEPSDPDYDRLIDAFKIRGDFATLVDAKDQTYVSGPDVNRTLVSDPLAAKVAEGRVGYQTITMAGEPTLVVGGQVRSGQLSIYFFYPQGQRLAELARLRNILLVTGSILTVLGAVAGFLVARGLVRPIRRASRAAAQMSYGDLDIRLPVGSDEFGMLASSFNRMAGNLKAKMADLEAGQARERRFVADVAHELRTPVSALVGEASLLQSKLTAEPGFASTEIGRLVGMVNADIARLRQLVDDLLEISRLESQAAEPLMESVELDMFVSRLIQVHGWSKTVRLLLNGVNATSNGSESPLFRGPVVQADRRRLERIVVNVVENAFQHGAAPVTIEVRFKPAPRSLGFDEGSIVQVLMTDEGQGIPAEHLPHVFDRFYKADPSRSSSRGSGLGLAIARENARLLGGDLTATNIPGGGARFILTLPVADS